MVYQASLLIRKQEIQKMIAEKTEQMMEASTELSVFGHEVPDMAFTIYEKEKNAGLIEILQFELEKVNEALEKSAAGEYGKCESCGAVIEDQRLQSKIDAKFCSHCEEQRKILH